MGIKKEIERFKSAEQALFDEEANKKKQLIGKIEAIEERLWVMAREAIVPFAQKLQQSGVVEIFDELIKEEDLHKYKNNPRERKSFFKKNQGLKAQIEIESSVVVGNRVYRFSGFDLKRSNSEGNALRSRSNDWLQKYYDKTATLVNNSNLGSLSSAAILTWNWIRNQDYELYSFLCFSLSRQGNNYELKLRGKTETSFPESSWSKEKLEQAVAKTYFYHKGIEKISLERELDVHFDP